MKSENAQKTKALWQKTKYANLVRNGSSGIYFARFRHNGKLIWRGLDTDVLTTAAQRLPNKIKQVKDELALLSPGSDPRITVEAAARIYLERVKSSPDFKARPKDYHEQRLDAFLKSWPDVKTKPVKDITKDECIEWRNRFAAEYSSTSFNHTLGIVRSIFEIGIEAGARRDNPAKAKEMKRLSETTKRLRLPKPDEFEKFIHEIETVRERIFETVRGVRSIPGLRWIPNFGFGRRFAARCCFDECARQGRMPVVHRPEERDDQWSES